MSGQNQNNIDQNKYFSSEIHLENNALIEQKNESGLYLSRFEFSLPLEIETEHGIEIDSDGDLIPKRNTRKCFFIIEHEMRNRLDDVGFQLWRASFYLSDFILNNLDIIKGQVVVDLGSGLGITSFVSSFYSEMVYCTDLEQVVQKAEYNWNLNKENFQDLIEKNNNKIHFKSIDWSEYEAFLEETNIDESDSKLRKTDLENLKLATVFLASDVIYDDKTTLNFLNSIYKLITFGIKQPKICLIANEKRINFSAETFSCTDPAFDFFFKCMNDLNEYEDTELGYRFFVEKVETNDSDKLVKYFLNYKRNKFLNIWKIKCLPI